MNREGRAELVQQVRAKIDELGVTYIYYQFVSVTGRIVGKGIPADHWEQIAERGFQLRLRLHREPLHRPPRQLHRLYGPEASELVGIPDPETFVQLPWEQARSRGSSAPASATARSGENPGGHLTSDCRGNLRIAHDEFQAKHGMQMRHGHRAGDDVAQAGARTAAPTAA